MKNYILLFVMMMASGMMMGQFKVTSDGVNNALNATFKVGELAGAETASVMVGNGRTSPGVSQILFYNETNSSAQTRFFRNAVGAAGLTHTGVQPLLFSAVDAADLLFRTNGANRVRISKNTGFVGVGLNAPATSMLDVGGDIKMNGSVVLTSDKRLKKNEKAFKYGLNEVMQLRPISYSYNGKANTHDDGNVYVGLYAQELQKLVPDLVSKFSYQNIDENGNTIGASEEYLQINDTGIKYLLINAIKEQQETIASLISKNEALESKVNEILTTLSNSDRASHTIEAELNSRNLAEVNQNKPNPFNAITSIDYFIPESSQSAEMRVTDLQGRLIKTIKIDQKGDGKIVLRKGEIPSGVYLYTLIVDESPLNTLKMSIIE